MSPEPLQENIFYHVYNRGINGCDIFPEDRNFDYFLNLYQKHISPTIETFAYCLLRNHFHLLIKAKSNGLVSVGSLSKKLSNLFNAYAQGFNKVYGRTGGLFETPFKRKKVENQDYLRWLVWYIHANPQRHGLIDDFRSWPGSSYQSIVNDWANPVLNKQETLSWFEGMDEFLKFHSINRKDLEGYAIEE